MVPWGLNELALLKVEDTEREIAQLRLAAAARPEPRERARVRVARLLTRIALRIDRIATRGVVANVA